jgi:hypothetical protein
LKVSDVTDRVSAADWMSTIGLSPVTVMVSSTLPTFISASTVDGEVHRHFEGVALHRAEAGQAEGDRIDARRQVDDPILAVAVADGGSHLFDERRAGGLDGDSGSTAPEASLTTPATVPCASAAVCPATRQAMTRAIRVSTRMLMNLS